MARPSGVRLTSSKPSVLPGLPRPFPVLPPPLACERAHLVAPPSSGGGGGCFCAVAVRRASGV
eukprot:318493-Alexandrium_andersonii.AAC.1